MSKEEKEAIDYLKKLDIMFIASGLKKRTRQAIKIILNLIDKLQKDNYKLDRENQLRFENNIELQKGNEQLELLLDKSVDEQLEREKYTHELEKKIEKYAKQIDLEYVEENFISKDKIRGKIKELKVKREKSGSSIYGYGIYFLEELLKEG